MEKIKATISLDTISSNSKQAFSLNDKSFFGEKVEDKINYSFSEALYLIEKNKLDVYHKNKKIKKEELLKVLEKHDKKIDIKYLVFKDLREKGYIVKTALKFGSEFRVYDKGKKPKKEHSRWIVFVDREAKKISWYEFSAKNRVAHSTRKKLLIAIVDDEGKVLYYEIKWIKP